MRQYKLFILLIQAFCLAQTMKGGFERTAQPTPAFARAFSGTAMQTESNVWINPAALSSTVSFHSSIFYSPSPFQLSQLTNYGFLVSNNFEFMQTGIAISSFGFSLYKETVGSIIFSRNEFENLHLGVSLSFFNISIAEYGSAMAVAVDIGLIYSFYEDINVGIALNNLMGTSFGEDDDVPQAILAGISYHIIESAIINLDIVKDVRYEPTYRTGVELTPHEVITVRTGVQGEPSRIFAGIGINILPLTVEYGIATHDDLGLTHSLGISFTP